MNFLASKSFLYHFGFRILRFIVASTHRKEQQLWDKIRTSESFEDITNAVYRCFCGLNPAFREPKIETFLKKTVIIKDATKGGRGFS